MIKSLEESKRNNELHPLNATRVFIFLAELVMKKEKVSKENLIDKAALIVKKLLLEGRQIALNPCIDKIWEFNNNDVIDGLKKLIKKKSEFLESEIDKNMNHVKLSFLLDIVFGNLDPFIESEEIEIEKIEIQTPLYIKTIEE